MTRTRSSRKKAPEQLFIDGTEPVTDPRIERAIKHWLEAKSEQVDASKNTKQKHGHLLMVMAEVGVEKHAYLDPVTGKRKYVVADKTPRVKVVPASSGEKPRKKRTTAAEVDPFASTRGLLDEAKVRQANGQAEP